MVVVVLAIVVVALAAGEGIEVVVHIYIYIYGDIYICINITYLDSICLAIVHMCIYIYIYKFRQSTKAVILCDRNTVCSQRHQR